MNCLPLHILFTHLYFVTFTWISQLIWAWWSTGRWFFKIIIIILLFLVIMIAYLFQQFKTRTGFKINFTSRQFHTLAHSRDLLLIIIFATFSFLFVCFMYTQCLCFINTSKSQRRWFTTAKWLYLLVGRIISAVSEKHKVVWVSGSPFCCSVCVFCSLLFF